MPQPTTGNLKETTTDIYIPVGDLHINAKKTTPYIIDAAKSLVTTAMKHINDYYLEQKCMWPPSIHLVLLGDLVNTAKMDEDTCNNLCKLLSNLKQLSKGSISVLRGNHDNSALHPDTVVWRSLQHHESHPTIYSQPYLQRKVMFVPHAYGGQTLARTGAKLVFGHLAVPNAQMEYEQFYTKPDVLRDIPEDTYVVLGHLHTPMEYGNVVFPGSVCPTNWADNSTQRCAYIIGVNGNTGEVSGVDKVSYPHMITKTVYSEEDVANEPNVLYRLVVPKLTEDMEQLTKLHNLQISVAKNAAERRGTTAQTDEDIIKRACQKRGVPEAPVTRVLRRMKAID